MPRSKGEAQTRAIRPGRQHLPPEDVADLSGSNDFRPTQQAGLRPGRHQRRRVHEGSNDATAGGLTNLELDLGASPAGDHRIPGGAFPVSPMDDVS